MEIESRNNLAPITTGVVCSRWEKKFPSLTANSARASIPWITTITRIAWVTWLTHSSNRYFFNAGWDAKCSRRIKGFRAARD